MKRSLLIAAIVAGSTIMFARFAAAQFYPTYGYGYGNGCWGDAAGAAALLGSDYRQAASMQIASQNRLAGQQAALAQSETIQNSIRNTLTSQAQRRTDALVDGAQANQDWFFQYQAQQMAQRQAAAYSAPPRAAPAREGPPPSGPANSGPSDEAPSNESPSSENSSNLAPSSAMMSSGIPTNYAPDGGQFSPRGGPPPVAMDIIQWPKLLQNSSFASERAQIEAPYRRTPPKLSDPGPADYRKMIPIIEDMKAVLDWMLRDGIRTSDYNAAKSFLGAMEQEATARSAQ